ncbi:hypothetical protein [Paracoccus beibuensis]|uniref:hypothetical protein n=1 Tax=Paracoccus beibuensis TaxID=547602 RepID=UPI00223F35DA|nr:hypothetical protein [Paracoccus beibuensis]
MTLHPYQAEQLPQIHEAIERFVAEISSGALFWRQSPFRFERSHAEQDFRTRVIRSGAVPIEEVVFKHRGFRKRVLIAPVCKGAASATLRVRCFQLSDLYEGAGVDLGRSTVSMSVSSSDDQSIPQMAWSMLSSHQRMAMFSAVAHRTPKGGAA